MNIAIIGSGISGMSAAYILNQKYNITLYEKEHRIGGHSRTVEIDYNGKKIAVDTGFIVFNYRNYPHLSALFKLLEVEVQKSNMSFGVTIDNGAIEYSAENLSSLFGQRRNLLRPQFYKMLFDINKFSKQAKSSIQADETISLGQLLTKLNLGNWFKNYFILPMASAIWSCPINKILEFPAKTFVTFFDNHGLLTVSDQPQWYTVKGGSQNYVKKLTASFNDKILYNSKVISVTRNDGKVQITDQNNNTKTYDKAIFACHADETVEMIKDLTNEEKSVLQNFKYQENVAYLHNDLSIMPKRKKCYASWIYKAKSSETSPMVDISYWMNHLQNIDKNYPIFVTLNPLEKPQDNKIFDRHIFHHPIFDQKAIDAQALIPSIQGIKNSYYCGAYTRYGFHEDGILSAVNIAKILEVEIPWN